MKKPTAILANDNGGEGFLYVTHGDRRIHLEFQRGDHSVGFALLPQDAKELMIAILGGKP